VRAGRGRYPLPGPHAGKRVGRKPCRAQAVLVVVGPDADAHAALASVERPARIAGVLEGAPGHFQKQALLGIHLDRFAWRNPEEQWIEQVDPAEAPSPFAVALAGRSTVLGEERGNIETVRRQFTNRIVARR